jgi:hypothetical protein
MWSQALIMEKTEAVGSLLEGSSSGYAYTGEQILRAGFQGGHVSV